MSINPGNLEYKFTSTQDWFSGHIPNWTSVFPLVTTKDPKILEVGSWEGRSATFLLNSPLCAAGGSIVCIDHFDLLKTRDGIERRSKIRHNLTLTGKPFRIFDNFSVPALMSLLEEAISTRDPGYDWIYIDGSHEADDTFLDGELAWRLAKKDAIVIFDDYDWNKEPKDSVHHPKRGIDAFMKLHEGEFEVLSSAYQMILRKTSDMRIGFLVKDKGEVGLEETLGYGVHIALTINSSYAMAAAVTMRSIVENTDARVTFYIIDCGLMEEDRTRIHSSMPERRNLTLKFLSLPQNSLTKEMGVVWAKVDMLKALPVERVLYLDADTLIRADITPLWSMDLMGKPIGAVQDIGFPMGHKDIQRAPYFNAGVMLMDLARIRGGIDDLEALARKMKRSKYRDQDALNAYFRNNWASLHLGWNAQGLGTYAGLPSADRELLCLNDMEDAAIVHFTGPVSPGMEQVLNPYLQPCTCKPWGYLGSPGHPHAGEWWEMLEKTAWSPTWAKSADYIDWRKGEVEKVKQTAITEFDLRVQHMEG